MWIRDDIETLAPIDTIIFDVDGVLWDTSGSFDEAVQLTVDHVLRHWFDVPDPRPVTTEELRAFRLAGGLNSDWDMSYMLTATRLAGRDDIEQAAAESAGRGRAWAETLLDGHTIDFGRLTRLFNEYYWGREEYTRRHGEAPRYAVQAKGCWHNEKRLVAENLLERLRSVGIDYFGIATGRDRQELSTVLDSSGLDRDIPRQAMVTGDILTKPDGRVLQRVLAALDELAHGNAQPGPGAALFCGDTRDDLDVVVNYRRLTVDRARWIGAVAVVDPDEMDFYRHAGSDAAIASVNDLPQLVQTLNQRS